MKRYLLLFCSAMLFVLACEKDDTMVILKSTPEAPALINLDNGFTKEITPEILSDKVDFKWEKANYGVSTEVKYTLEMTSGCDSFTNPVVLGTTNATSLSLTLDNINTRLLSDLKAAPHRTIDVKVRLTATVRDQYLTVSEEKTLTFTPWSDRPIALWLGENSTSAPVLIKKSANHFEGYAYHDDTRSFRFTNNTTCADSVFGQSSTEGVLSLGAESPSVSLGTSGYYKINVNTETLAYTKTKINTWGMVGTATPGSWFTSTPMIYNADMDVWEAQLDLAPGALKFRANDSWDINYGPADSNVLNGKLVETNDAINIVEGANYKVTIDFSQSDSPYAYTYTVVKSGDVAAPAKLWLPGGYQGWSPATAPTIYAINDAVFEGYIFIPEGTGFKFTNAPDWDHINYGDSGTPGVLTTDGLANGLSINTSGYYKLTANVVELTYDIRLVNSWGMIGTATPGAWDNSSPLTYDMANDVWKATINLIPGALKFRANNNWDLNYGPAVISDLNGTLIQTNDSINISEAGSYTVTLDFSRSEAPYKYTYTVVKN